jgi:hypothetical protein
MMYRALYMGSYTICLGLMIHEEEQQERCAFQLHNFMDRTLYDSTFVTSKWTIRGRFGDHEESLRIRSGGGLDSAGELDGGGTF